MGVWRQAGLHETELTFAHNRRRTTVALSPIRSQPRPRHDLACGGACGLLLLAGLSALVLLPGTAQAACTETGTTATCIGDLGSLIDYDTGDGIDTIIIETLTSDFEINAGSAVKLKDKGAAATSTGDDGSAGSSLSVSFDGGDYGITGIGSDGITQYGFDIKSTGGEGATGADVSDTDTVAGEGGAGGAGGDASLEMTSGFLSQTIWEDSAAAIPAAREARPARAKVTASRP
jgi:hypothetical protein